uniref:NADH dehydrogenase subunit 4L n=1 Tax=Carrhotus xanthogramma TaxID=1112393 RepID=A0A0H3W0X9_CARXA|nr:NADH dehydrogenase subunit 4L [Carrhotus xanthogramma]AKH36474.1 NADH dehydrogenase subunit 4L [Carrhotus xanthogramma]
MNLLFTMIMMSLTSMCWWRKNIILMLLSLEMLIMSLFTLMATSLPLSNMSSLLLMLVMMVSGSSFGLSLLVSMSHTYNSSNSIYINLLTYVKYILYFNISAMYNY